MTQDPKRPIQSFKSTLRTRGTCYAYQAAIFKFLDSVYGSLRKTRVDKRAERATPDEALEYEKRAARYLKAKRNRGDDLIAFVEGMKTAGTPPKTIHQKVTGIRAWLLYNDIELSAKETRTLKSVSPKNARTTGYGWLTPEMIRDVLQHLGVRDRALVLCLASTGARIHEILALRWEDVKIPDRSRNPDAITSIYLRKTKTGIPRTAFISREAEEALLQWRRVRGAYLEKVKNRNAPLVRAKYAQPKTTDTDLVFPFRRTSAYRAWDEAMKAAGYFKRDPITNQAELSYKALRSFFKSQAMAAGIPMEVSELLLGHSDAYGDAYRRQPPEALAGYFRKLEPFVTIANPAPSQERHARAIKGLEEENTTLRERVATLESAQEKLIIARESPEYQELLERVKRLERGT